jgi:hypothetical protein
MRMNGQSDGYTMTVVNPSTPPSGRDARHQESTDMARAKKKAPKKSAKKAAKKAPKKAAKKAPKKAAKKAPKKAAKKAPKKAAKKAPKKAAKKAAKKAPKKAAAAKKKNKKATPAQKRSHDVRKLYDRWTQTAVRSGAMECAEVGECHAYVGELIDALDDAFAAVFLADSEIEDLQDKEVFLLEALEKTEAELKAEKRKLDGALKRKAVKATDLKGIKEIMAEQTRELRSLKTAVSKLARGQSAAPPPKRARQLGLGAKKAAKKRTSRTRSAPSRGRQLELGGRQAVFKHTSAISGAGCSLAAVRYGYKGTEDCDPGFTASRAGSMLANARWSGIPVATNPGHSPVQFNPSDYYDMGYEDGVKAGGTKRTRALPKPASKKKAAKKAGVKKNPSKRATEQRSAKKANRKSRVTAAKSNPTNSPSAAAKRVNRQLARLL